MATSKNNRKKGKKRQKSRSAQQAQEKRNAAEVTRMRDWKRDQVINFVALVIMVGGFLVATFTSYGIVGYPIAALGAAVSLVRTKWDTTNHKISIVCYVAVIILLMLSWFNMLNGNQA